MNRPLSALGVLLVLLGLGLLAYVGVGYARDATPRSPRWSSAQAARGAALARSLRGRQQVAVPAASRRIPTGEPAIRMTIPRIGVDAPVVQTAPVAGVWNVADWAIGHLATSPNPGMAGNGAYAAHDDIKGEIFKRLGELSPGDGIFLYTLRARYRYVVVGQQTVSPADVAVLAPTTAPTITLVTCTPYWVDSNRLVVQAVLKARSAASRP